MSLILRSNVSQTSDQIGQLINAISDTKTPLQNFAKYTTNQHRKALQGRFDPVTGKPWQKLKRPSTRPPSKRFQFFYADVAGDSITVGYRDNVSLFQHFGVRVPARTIIPKNRQALYWAGAAHPVKKVQQPAFSVPGRPRLGFSSADLLQFELLVSQSIDATWNG